MRRRSGGGRTCAGAPRFPLPLLAAQTARPVCPYPVRRRRDRPAGKVRPRGAGVSGQAARAGGGGGDVSGSQVRAAGAGPGRGEERCSPFPAGRRRAVGVTGAREGRGGDGRRVCRSEARGFDPIHGRSARWNTATIVRLAWRSRLAGSGRST